MLRNADWAQRYRPTTLNDMVLPERMIKRLDRLVNAKGGMSLLFHGHPGTGKTTAAKLLNPDATVYINCTASSSIEMVRNLHRTCSSMTLEGTRRLVLLDEADFMSKEAQAALRGVVEELSVTNDFVMTGNDPERLSEAMKSRFLPVSFDFLKDEELMGRAERRLELILRAEGHDSPSSSVVRSIVREAFPDMRRMIKLLQFEVGASS